MLCSLLIFYLIFFQVWRHHASPQRQWPLNPCSANQREFRDLAGTWLPVDCLRRNMFCCFSMFFTLLFCFCDADLRGLCCRPASLTSYSHLNFVADFVNLWVWKLLKNWCTQRLLRTGQNGLRWKRNGTERNRMWFMIEGHDELMIGWLRYVGVVCEMWVWPCWCGCGHVDVEDAVAANAVKRPSKGTKLKGRAVL